MIVVFFSSSLSSQSFDYWQDVTDGRRPRQSSCFSRVWGILENMGDGWNLVRKCSQPPVLCSLHGKQSAVQACVFEMSRDVMRFRVKQIEHQMSKIKNGCKATKSLERNAFEHELGHETNHVNSQITYTVATIQHYCLNHVMWVCENITLNPVLQPSQSPLVLLTCR